MILPRIFRFCQVGQGKTIHDKELRKVDTETDRMGNNKSYQNFNI